VFCRDLKSSGQDMTRGRVPQVRASPLHTARYSQSASCAMTQHAFTSLLCRVLHAGHCSTRHRPLYCSATAQQQHVFLLLRSSTPASTWAPRCRWPLNCCQEEALGALPRELALNSAAPMMIRVRAGLWIAAPRAREWWRALRMCCCNRDRRTGALAATDSCCSNTAAQHEGAPCGRAAAALRRLVRCAAAALPIRA